MKRKKKFLLNSISSLVYQIATIVCGLILPNLILQAYGTEVNGLVASITQFLRVVSLSEFGMTAVIQSSLYKPLAEKDTNRISEIVTSSDLFFRNIAYFLCGYVLLLCIFYPLLIHTEFGKTYVLTLIIILSFNLFSQYMFAFTNSQLLSADQRYYVVSTADIVAIVLNTTLCAIEINLGYSIHTVKLTTAFVYLIKPISTHIYIHHHYNINRHAKNTRDAIEQKWNGVAQHLANYVSTSTDIVVLTFFSTLSNVSIYSVYVLILNGLKSVSAMFEHAMRSLMGEIWALHEEDRLKQYFSLYEWSMCVISCFLFGCASSLIVSFVQVYTRNVHDADYNVPLFALLISLAFLIHNIRAPYHTLIQSVGCYRQTQCSYIAAMAINIILSVLMVYKYGLIGVAFGTLVAAFVETIWQSLYLYRVVLKRHYSEFIILLATHSINFVISSIICSHFSLASKTYYSWILIAFPIVAIWVATTFVTNLLFYKKQISFLFGIISSKSRNK